MADPTVSGGTIPSGLIPQADRPELVTEVIAFIARVGRRPEEGEGGLTHEKRQLDYACQAAALLGFLDSHDEVTEAGRILLTLSRDLQLLRLVFAFEGSEVGQAWITWAQVKELSEVDPTTAPRFLSERAANADTTTADRRADTLRTWAKKFRELRDRDAGPNLSFGDWSPLEKPAHESIDGRNVFVEGGSDRVLRILAPTTRQLRIASGFFTISGYLRV